MSKLNEHTIFGYLGKDAEMRYLQSGTPVCNASIAQDRGYYSKKNNSDGEWVEETQWYRLVFWNDQAERAAKLLKKRRDDVSLFVIASGVEVPKGYVDKNGDVQANLEFKVSAFKVLPVLKGGLNTEETAEEEEEW